MGDFLGFTFGGIHSSDLGITRVSGGDRYEEELHPEVSDRTAEVPGLDGEYFFSSEHKEKTFEVSIAFDSLTEKQFRKLRTAFNTKKIQELIFDERPYKKYIAKLKGPVELSYICFEEPIKVKFSEEYNIGTINTEFGAVSDEVLVELPDGIRMIDDGQGNRVREKIDPWVYKEGTQRIYKGEGKMTFICYFPFAKSNFKVLPNERNEEWAISSGLLTVEEYQNDNIDTYHEGIIKIYNPGDMETGFRLYIPAAAVNQQTILSYNGTQLVLSPIELKENNTNTIDAGIIVDTNTGLINGIIPSTMTITKIDPETGDLIEVEEVDEAIHIDYNGNVFYTTSGNIYNENVEAGYFFKLQPTEYKEYSTLEIQSTGTGFQIFYDYLYF